MEKNRIGIMQLVILLFLSRQFTSLTYFPGIGTPVSGTATLVGNVISTLFLPLMFLPFLLLSKRYPECSIVMGLSSGLGKFGRFAGWFYYFYILVLAAHTLSHFQFFMINAVFPDASVWVIVLPMLAVAVYAAYIGVEGIARSGFFIFIGFLLAFGLIVFSSIPNIELNNLKPIEKNIWQELTGGVYGTVSRSTEPILFGMLLPYVGNKTGKVVAGFTALSIGVLEITAFFILTVLGDFSYSQFFPFYSLASMSEISIFQRMDALYMGIWVLIGFIKLSLLLLLGKDIFPLLLPQRVNQNARRLSLPVTAMLVLGLAIPACYRFELLSLSYQLVFNGIIILLFVVIFPLILWIKSTLKRKGKSK